MMNPGLGEEVGQTARAAVHVLESQPLALAMILSNFILLGYLFYTGAESNKLTVQSNEQRAELGKLVMQSNAETQKLLSKCVVPN